MSNNSKHIFMSIVGLSILAMPIYADIIGTVFEDIPVDGNITNTYGHKDANEYGISGITVTGVDSAGTKKSATTADDGTYTLSGLSGDVRVTFSGLPTYLDISPDGGSSNSNAAVRFVQEGDTVNFGLHNPNDYSSVAQPDYVTNIFSGGSGIDNETFDLVTNHYTDSELNSDYKDGNGDQGTGPTPTVLLQQKYIGTVWGLATEPKNHRIYMSTLLKRHFGFADGNPSRIWYTDYSLATPSDEVHYFDLQDVNDIDLGDVNRTGDNALDDDPTVQTHDDDAYAKIAKMAYGGLAYDAKTETLWTVNLKQRAIIKIETYGIDASNDSVDSSTVHQYKLDDLNAPACDNGTLRPWAIAIHNGEGYLGAVCDANESDNYNDLKAYVLSFELDNPSTNGLTTEVDYAMNYDRSKSAEGTASADSHYFAWSDEYKESESSGYWDHYNQPILSDIVFDENNTMYLAFMDRYGLQIGNNKNYSYPPASEGEDGADENSYGGGEMRKVCFIDGSYVVEGTDASCAQNSFDEPNGDTDIKDFFNDFSGDETANPGGGAYALIKGSHQILRVITDPHPVDDSGQAYWHTNGVETFSLETGDNVNWYGHLNSDGVEFTGKAAGMGDLEFLTEPAPIEIGNRVWEDTNGNGIQDAGEVGIEGVTVHLFDSDDNKIGEVNTSSSGTYIFSNDPLGTDDKDNGYDYGISELVPNSNYTIKVPNVKGASKQLALGTKVLTTQDESSATEATDSDGALSDNDAEVEVLETDIPTVGANNHDFDFGFVEPASIGDRVWYDDNRNGIQDSGEDGVENVTVKLLDDSGAEVANTTTDANGNYSFTDLEPADYQVEFDLSTLPADYIVSDKDQGSDDAKDSDANITTGKTEVTTLEADENDISWDMGINKAVGNLSGNVSEDTNNDDEGDVNLEDVTITLYEDPNCDGTKGDKVADTKTDSDGNYKFENINAGCYVVVESQPDGYVDVSKNEGGDDNDSQGNTDTNEISGKVDADETDTHNDFVEEKECKSYILGDLFWVDNNKDAIYNNGEKVISGALVELLSENGNVLKTTRTDANGRYYFNVSAGIYKVKFNIPRDVYPAYVFSKKGNLSADNTNKVGKDGITNSIVVGGDNQVNGNNLTLDAAINCGCDNAPIKASGADALGFVSMLLMIMMTLLTTLFFIKKEKYKGK